MKTDIVNKHTVGYNSKHVNSYHVHVICRIVHKNISIIGQLIFKQNSKIQYNRLKWLCITLSDFKASMFVQLRHLIVKI